MTLRQQRVEIRFVLRDLGKIGNKLDSVCTDAEQIFLAINEDVLRFMTVAVEELEEAPSAMLRKEERAERSFGERDGGSSRGGDRPRRENTEARGDAA